MWRQEVFFLQEWSLSGGFQGGYEAVFCGEYCYQSLVENVS